MPNLTLYVSINDKPVIDELAVMLETQNQSLSGLFVQTARDYIKNGPAVKTDPLNERLVALEKRLEALETMVIAITDDVITHDKSFSLRQYLNELKERHI